MPTAKAQRSVQSVEVGGRLLLALAQHTGPMNLKDLAAAAGLPASRAHPYLVSFARLGFVEQVGETGQYALGPAAFQVGLACLHQSDALKAAAPVVEDLLHRIDQTVAVAVWANFGPTIVRLAEGSRPLHVNMRAGTVMSLLGTATGRAFAAVMPRARIDQALAAVGHQALQARAPVRSVPQALKEIAAEYKAHGLARAVGNPIPGVNAFSAAARDHEGQPVLVVTALGHEDDFDADWASPVAQAVREAAEAISHRLGYRPARAASGG